MYCFFVCWHLNQESWLEDQDSGLRNMAIKHSLKIRQLILGYRRSTKMHKTIGTPPCTLRPPWVSVVGQNTTQVRPAKCPGMSPWDSTQHRWIILHLRNVTMGHYTTQVRPQYRLPIYIVTDLGIPHTVLSVRRAPQNWCSSLLYGTRLPMGQWGAKQIIYIPFHSLCCSSLSQRQSRPIQKRGADQLCSPFSVLLLAVPEAVSSHTKVRRISSTRS